MTILKIELIDPRAQALLEDLANMDIIKIYKESSPEEEFLALLAKLRAHSNDLPTDREITDEVEWVRTKRQRPQR